MEDVTANVGGLLFIGSFAVDWIAPGMRGRKLLGLSLLVASGIVWWTGVDLPISREAAWYLDIVTFASFVVLILVAAPGFLREVKAAARE